ncbi:hypothetical protein CEXT_798571 [Caerostris extrusa]|uniref:Uncharacterized protein n=1 Tax=Caerostris extrusa TaxID=172846 RepID=A0AAV4Q123_CAEEX|nr:hypothetical protein CEXT_798571 [Caerostris extrusa]
MTSQFDTNVNFDSSMVSIFDADVKLHSSMAPQFDIDMKLPISIFTNEWLHKLAPMKQMKKMGVLEREEECCNKSFSEKKESGIFPSPAHLATGRDREN